MKEWNECIEEKKNAIVDSCVRLICSCLDAGESGRDFHLSCVR